MKKTIIPIVAILFLAAGVSYGFKAKNSQGCCHKDGEAAKSCCKKGEANAACSHESTDMTMTNGIQNAEGGEKACCKKK